MNLIFCLKAKQADVNYSVLNIDHLLTYIRIGHILKMIPARIVKKGSVSYTHHRAHETAYTISFSVV